MAKKRHRYTMDSSVRTLSIKCYAEQLKGGWKQVSDCIRKVDKKVMYAVGICHDKDFAHDDIWESAKEKPHYHIIVKVLNGKQKSVGCILHILGVEYRKGLDDVLWDNHGVETVKDFSAMLKYLTHETEQAELDGKTIYPIEELVSNISLEEITHIRKGYSSTKGMSKKITLDDLSTLDNCAYSLGHELGDFDTWYGLLDFPVRSHTKMKTIEESYYRGVMSRVSEHTEMVRLCIFIKGEPNSGKTYSAEKALSEYHVMKVSGGGSGKFDYVKPFTDAIIIDDDICPNLLNLSDNYMTFIYRRNRHNPVWAGKFLVVTSNLYFDDWLKECGISQSKHFEALKSRFYICAIDTTDEGKRFLKCISPSKRGDKGVQEERKKLYAEFREKFNASQAKYTSSEPVSYDDINGEYTELIKQREEKLDELLGHKKDKDE